MYRRIGLAVLAVLLFAVPAHAVAKQPTAKALIDSVKSQATVDGVSAKKVLGTKLKLKSTNGTKAKTSLRKFIKRSSGKTTMSHGYGGLDQIAAGNLLHIYAHVETESFISSATPLGIPRSSLPPEPDVTKYDVKQSAWFPSTPLVPVINPLLLAGADLPPEAPAGLSAPLLFLHAGGPLTSVEGGGWNTLGTHQAGSQAIGNSAELAERETTDDDPWPFYLPLVTGGTLSDESLQFLGFGIVVDGQGCTVIGTSTRAFARICVGVGAIIGDGVSIFDEAQPSVNLRELVGPFWEEPPPEIGQLNQAIEDAIAQVPLGDVLGLLGEVPDVPAP